LLASYKLFLRKNQNGIIIVQEDPKTKEISNCAKSDARNLWHKTTKPNKLFGKLT
jgi:hypothetical protein